MNEQNLEYLEKQLFYTGFGEVSKQELQNSMSKAEESFQIRHEKQYGEDKVSAILNFKLSEKGNYFFNSFDMSLQKPGGEVDIVQIFKINFGSSYTLKEAYNMMDGRAVNKDFLPAHKKDEQGNVLPLEKDENGRLKTYNAWAYLDMTEKDTHGNFLVKKKFGYDLEAALSKQPIKELSFDQSKSELMDSLKKGNRQIVTMIRNGSEEKMYIEAAPRSASLNIYDSSMKRALLSAEKKPDDTTSKDQKQSKKESMAAGNQDDEREKKKGRTRKKAMG